MISGAYWQSLMSSECWRHILHKEGDRVNRLVTAKKDSLQVAAWFEDEQLMAVRFHDEANAQSETNGRFYVAVVRDVVPGMEAAFLDAGLEKPVYLSVKDALPAHIERRKEDRRAIQELLQVGQKLLVQRVKDAEGGKGARVTTHYQLAGGLLVYLPDADYVTVSQSIGNDAERARLLVELQELVRPGEGWIIRSAAIGAQAVQFAAEMAVLRTRWEDLTALFADAEGCGPLDEAPSFKRQILREFQGLSVSEWVCDEIDVGRHEDEFYPQWARTPVQVADGFDYLEQQHRFCRQLEQLCKPRVWLKSGGYVVMHRTEAMTIFDVNSGKYTGGHTLEQTVFTTNQEAVPVISQLIRVHEIGGIIIIDFIDMKVDEHRADILARMQAQIARDSAKWRLVGWTGLGLMELTRRKKRSGSPETLLQRLKQLNIAQRNDV
jgi:ribonuclease G